MTQIHMDHYFNTVPEPPETLAASEAQARHQEAVILRLFEDGTHQATPWMIYDRLTILGYEWPITSVRRAMSVLTRRGKLVKTARKRMGPEGKLNCVWELRNQ